MKLSKSFSFFKMCVRSYFEHKGISQEHGFFQAKALDSRDTQGPGLWVLFWGDPGHFALKQEHMLG